MGSLGSLEIGCCKSHYNVLSNTRSELTLILEDDFQLCENFDSELEKCFNELPDNFEALFLGGRMITPPRDYSPNLFKIKATTGAYGYLVHRRFISKALNALAKENKLADWALSSVFENVYRSKNNLIKHRDGYSFLQEKEVAYKDLR